jgi:hypothetical protein
MRKQAVAIGMSLGLGLGFLAGCGDDVGDGTSGGRVSSVQSEASDVACLQNSLMASTDKLPQSRKWILKSCEILGTSEFRSGSDVTESNVIFLTFGNLATKGELECILADGISDGSGDALDCNWQKYNESDAANK